MGFPKGRKIPKNKRHKYVGEVSEAAILAKLISRGYPVSIPFGDNQRYDLIVERKSGLKRVQCKTGRLFRGVIGFALRSFTDGKDYSDSIDAFAVFCPENEKIYWIPIKVVAGRTRSLYLRVSEEYRKSNGYKILWAKDFEI